MAAEDQYTSDMEYLQKIVNSGTVDRSNRIWQKLNGKRNIRAVNDFLNSIAARTTGS